MAKLGKRTIDAFAIPQGARQAFLWDDEIKGFGVKAQRGPAKDAQTVKSFIYCYREGRGRHAAKRWLTLGRFGSLDLDDARKLAKEAAGRVAAGDDPAKRKRVTDDATRTVAKLIEDWSTTGALLDARTGRVRDPENVAADVAKLNAHVVPTLGRIRCADLTRLDVEKARDAIIAGKTARKRDPEKGRRGAPVKGGPGAAGRTLRTFAGVCAWGVRLGYLTSNPCDDVRLPKDGRRERVLSRAEIQALGRALDLAEHLTVKDIVAKLAAAKLTRKKPDPDRDFTAHKVNPYAVAQVRWILATGARRKEAQSVKWRALDLDGGTWRITDDKGQAGARPLSRLALAILAGLGRRAGSPWVFPSEDGESYYSGLSRVWRDYIAPLAKLCAQEAGATFGDDVTLHVIRHSFATTGALMNANAGLLQSVLGHRSVSTTLRYTHVSVAPAQAAADLIAAKLAGADLQEKPAEVIPMGSAKARAS